MAEIQPRKILLTGASGAIGRCIGPALLAAGHKVRGLDRAPAHDLDEHVTADITDRDAVCRAMAGRDTLVHLAAYPNGHQADFVDVLLQPNIVGLYTVMDAARTQGIERVVLASSIQLTSSLMRRLDRDVTTDDAAPWNDYALTKLFAEQLGAMWARNHQMSVIAARLGWFLGTAEEVRRMVRHPRPGLYLSHDDAQQFFLAAVAADLREHASLPDPFAAVFATGPRPDGRPYHVDLGPGRRLLGYEPKHQFPAGLPPQLLRDADIATPEPDRQ